MTLEVDPHSHLPYLHRPPSALVTLIEEKTLQGDAWKRRRCEKEVRREPSVLELCIEAKFKKLRRTRENRSRRIWDRPPRVGGGKGFTTSMKGAAGGGRGEGESNDDPSPPPLSLLHGSGLLKFSWEEEAALEVKPSKHGRAWPALPSNDFLPASPPHPTPPHANNATLKKVTHVPVQLMTLRE